MVNWPLILLTLGWLLIIGGGLAAIVCSPGVREYITGEVHEDDKD